MVMILSLPVAPASCARHDPAVHLGPDAESCELSRVDPDAERISATQRWLNRRADIDGAQEVVATLSVELDAGARSTSRLRAGLP